MSNYTAIELLKSHAGRDPGFVFTQYPIGAAKYLISKGIARFIQGEAEPESEDKPEKPTKRRRAKA